MPTVRSGHLILAERHSGAVGPNSAAWDGGCQVLGARMAGDRVRLSVEGMHSVWLSLAGLPGLVEMLDARGDTSTHGRDRGQHMTSLTGL